MSQTEQEDFGVKEFPVGGKLLTLKFTAATRFRLFREMSPEQVQGYVSTEAFKLQAVALLLLGKQAVNMSIDEILDKFEELEFMEHELYAIHEWVLQRTVNFMLKEAEAAKEALQKAMPKVQELASTLTTFQG